MAKGENIRTEAAMASESSVRIRPDGAGAVTEGTAIAAGDGEGVGEGIVVAEIAGLRIWLPLCGWGVASGSSGLGLEPWV